MGHWRKTQIKTIILPLSQYPNSANPNLSQTYLPYPLEALNQIAKKGA